jgi:hypothetical protein
MFYIQKIITIIIVLFLAGCISSTNETIEGGTPDVRECSPIDGVSFLKSRLSIDLNQSQKAYQALVKNYYSCHNNHTLFSLHFN